MRGFFLVFFLRGWCYCWRTSSRFGLELRRQQVLGESIQILGPALLRGPVQRMLLSMSRDFQMVWSHGPHQHTIAQMCLRQGLRLVRLTGTVMRSLVALGPGGERRRLLPHPIIDFLGDQLWGAIVRFFRDVDVARHRGGWGCMGI